MATSSKLRELSATAGEKASEVRNKAARVGQRAAESGKNTTQKVRSAIKSAPPPSPNPMTNLVIADILMRSGGRLLRHTVEETLLGRVYGKPRAHQLVSSRSMKQTLISTMLAKIATRSVPGALLIGGGFAAKAFLDHRKGRAQSRAEGEAEVAKQSSKAGRG